MSITELPKEWEGAVEKAAIAISMSDKDELVNFPDDYRVYARRAILVFINAALEAGVAREGENAIWQGFRFGQRKVLCLDLGPAEPNEQAAGA